eukprot:4318416-Ditylum_brightwellii.AAC.1
MRLSGYMVAPNKPNFDALQQCMAYLYHHPHKPIMYPRKPLNNLQPKLELHDGNGRAEYLKQYKSFTTMYSDTDLARELRERRSTISFALLTNGLTTYWDISKQGEPTSATTSAELFALHKGIIKVSDICNFSSSIGYSIVEPSTVYEDNVGTIKAITADCTTPTHRPYNVKIFSVICHKQKGIITVEHSKFKLMLADPNKNHMAAKLFI